jgi:hypothetical protein
MPQQSPHQGYAEAEPQNPQETHGPRAHSQELPAAQRGHASNRGRCPLARGKQPLPIYNPRHNPEDNHNTDRTCHHNTDRTCQSDVN